MADFKWTDNNRQAVMLLAEGWPKAHVADEVGVDVSTVYRWVKDLEFSQEMDKITLQVGIATKAERLRIIMMAIRQKTKGDYVLSSRDPLDWLRLAREETDGIENLLTSVFANLAGEASGASEDTETTD